MCLGGGGTSGGLSAVCLRWHSRGGWVGIASFNCTQSGRGLKGEYIPKQSAVEGSVGEDWRWKHRRPLAGGERRRVVIPPPDGKGLERRDGAVADPSPPHRTHGVYDGKWRGGLGRGGALPGHTRTPESRDSVAGPIDPRYAAPHSGIFGGAAAGGDPEGGGERVLEGRG